MFSVSTWYPKWKIPYLTTQQVTGCGQNEYTRNTTYNYLQAACVNFVFGLRCLMPGRSPDIYANFPKSKANQESKTFLTPAFWTKDAQFVHAQEISLLWTKRDSILNPRGMRRGQP